MNLPPKQQFVAPSSFLWVHYFNVCQRGTIASAEVMLLCYTGWVESVIGYAYYLDTHHPYMIKGLSDLKYCELAVEGYAPEECRLVRHYGLTKSMIANGTMKFPNYVSSYSVEGTKKLQALAHAAAVVKVL